jgi:SagB-type dehydrogenase family enzyme
LRDAAVIVVLTTVLERSLWKYGDRGYRYQLLEAGHVAQNLNLVATALGLGSFNIGGFFDSDLANLLGLDIEEEIPLYGIALGTPFTDDRTDLRQPLD